MYYDFEHRLQGKAQEAAMALLFLEDQERQMNDPKMPVYAERFLQLYPETSWQPLVQEAMERTGHLTKPGFRKIFISRMSHKRKLSRILSHRIKGKLSLWTFGQRGVVLAVIPLLL